MEKNEYEMAHTVSPEEIDAFGHVNNTVYLRWFNGIATEHCAKAGWPGGKMWEMGQGWIIKSHSLEYILPLKPYVNVKIRTRVEWLKAASSERKYEVFDEKGRLCTKGSTIWVWVDYKSGRPMRIPAGAAAGFGF